MDIGVKFFLDYAVSKKWIANTPEAKYKVLVNTFNAATVLLTAAVAFAVLFSPSSALVYGSIGLFVRTVVQEELQGSDYSKLQKDPVLRLFNRVVWQGTV